MTSCVISGTYLVSQTFPNVKRLESPMFYLLLNWTIIQQIVLNRSMRGIKCLGTCCSRKIIDSRVFGVTLLCITPTYWTLWSIMCSIWTGNSELPWSQSDIPTGKYFRFPTWQKIKDPHQPTILKSKMAAECMNSTKVVKYRLLALLSHLGFITSTGFTVLSNCYLWMCWYDVCMWKNPA